MGCPLYKGTLQQPACLTSSQPSSHQARVLRSWKALGASSLIEKVTGVRGKGLITEAHFTDPLHKHCVSCQSVKISGFGFQMRPWACARLSIRSVKNWTSDNICLYFVLFNPFFLRMFYDICNSYSCTYFSLSVYTHNIHGKNAVFCFNWWIMWWK